MVRDIFDLWIFLSDWFSCSGGMQASHFLLRLCFFASDSHQRLRMRMRVYYQQRVLACLLVSNRPEDSFLPFSLLRFTCVYTSSAFCLGFKYGLHAKREKSGGRYCFVLQAQHI